MYIYQNEIWKDVPNINNGYVISNYGRLAKRISSNTLRMLHPRSNRNTSGRHKVGYLSFQFTLANKKHKHAFIHRLVASAFIPNPYNYPTVNHKDGNHFNNKVNNLEWMTYKANVQHAFDHNLMNNRKTKLSDIRYKVAKNPKNEHNSLAANIINGNKVFGYGTDGYLKYQFRSMREAERELNLSNGAVSKGIQHGWLYGQLFWSKNGHFTPKKVCELINHYKSINSKKHAERRGNAIKQYSVDGKYIATYPTYAEAARNINGKGNYISKCVLGHQKTYKGYIWKRA